MCRRITAVVSDSGDSTCQFWQVYWNILAGHQILYTQRWPDLWGMLDMLWLENKFSITKAVITFIWRIIFFTLTCWMRLIRLSSVSAMYSVPRWDRAMALAASRVARTAAHFTRWWSMPGTWQWMGRPATIRTWRLSDTWRGEKHTPVYKERGKSATSNFVVV